MSMLDTLRAMPPRRQIMLAALAAFLICCVLIGAYFLFLHKPYGVLFSNLRTMDAATIVSELEKKKVPYKLEAGGTTILVPAESVDNTRLSVMSEDLPLKGMVGFELFNKSDMGLTEFAQRINYQRALQGELARTIMTLDSVDTARVHLSLADQSIFSQDRKPSKASVTLLPRPGKRVSADTVRGIQRLVAASVPDLAVSDVVVLDETGAAVSGDSSVKAIPSAVDEQRQAIQLYYAARIRQALAGLDDSGADVSVEIIATPDTSQLEGGPPSLMAWSPQARTFPLSVTVATSSSPTPEIDRQIRRLTTDAAGLDAGKGDLLLVTTAPPMTLTSPVTPNETIAVDASAQKATAPSPLGYVANALLAVFSVGLIIVGYMIWRRSRPAPLSIEYRANLTRRLQTLLDEEDPHGATPA